MNPQLPAEPHDDGLEWLREIRRKITAEFDHDQQHIGDYLRKREEGLKDRVVRIQERVVPANQ